MTGEDYIVDALIKCKADYVCVGVRDKVTFLAPAPAFCFTHKESQNS